ncbi:hypothetical protein QYV50_005159 [Escherichia coli]|nr:MULTISPECIES: hypothetical protein [Escherichia]HDQ6557086.1 hypothetical protein [Escherichia coli O103:H25]EEQ3807625.1 hypothetical protein [Escherichia coli]EEQ3817651.1 hypothetical protein [Escherichia coli]EEQ3822848.1 hypothetical protein [Escherichia coli]EEQ5567144.1 hypothetical protein [Escherichia coli]
MEFLKEHHLPSIIFGIFSAIFWIISCFASSKEHPPKTEQGSFSSLGCFKAIEIQSKWNKRAAFCAALAVLAQVFSF